MQLIIIFLMIITSNDIYNITKENTKINYDKLTLIINDFLNYQKLNLKDISKIYLNRGPEVSQELEIHFL